MKAYEIMEKAFEYGKDFHSTKFYTLLSPRPPGAGFLSIPSIFFQVFLVFLIIFKIETYQNIYLLF